MGNRSCIANARIVDVVRGTIRPETCVVVENGQIADLLQNAPASFTDEILDADGLYLSPGLIDAHVHFVFDCGADPRATFLASDDAALWQAGRRNARTAIQAGITTARDCGAPAPWIFEFRRSVASGETPGPRILACGRPLTRPGGHLHYFGGAVATRDEVRSTVEQQAMTGANFVKVIASGGGLTPGTRPHEADFSLELMREACDAAHDLGILAAAHCHATESIRRAVAAGMDTIEHASFITPDGAHCFDAELAERIRERGTVVCPTVVGALRTVQRLRQSGQAHNPDDASAIARLEARRANLARFYEVGMPLLCGTDCGITDTPFDTLIDELLLFQQAGMPAAEAMRKATCDSARHLKLPGLGEIARGFVADAVLLDGNPLDNLRALRDPVVVLKDGRIVHQRRPLPRAVAVRAATC